MIVTRRGQTKEEAETNLAVVLMHTELLLLRAKIAELETRLEVLEP